MLTCAKMHFKGSSKEIGRLSSNMISNVKLEVEINNLTADFFFKGVFCFSLVNTEYVIKCQL